MKTAFKAAAIAATVIAAGATAGQAATFSYRGEISQEYEVVYFDIAQKAQSEAIFRTYSFEGGTMADGTVVSAGGFDPVLILFDETGAFVAGNDDRRQGQIYLDAELRLLLGPGNYKLALLKYSFSGLSSSTMQSLDARWRDNQDPYWDETFNRAPRYAVDVTYATVAPVPLPAGGLLMLSGLAGLAVLRRKRRSAA